MTNVLFVCTGNICRSPAAEGIFKQLVNDENLGDKISVDSAGTIGFHAGELPDERMRRQGKKRGYIFDSRSRQFNPHTDFDKFDYIITMDDYNYEDIMFLSDAQPHNAKIIKMVEFLSDKRFKEIPDPYGGDLKKFDLALDLLEEGTKNLLAKVKEEIDIGNKK